MHVYFRPLLLICIPPYVRAWYFLRASKTWGIFAQYEYTTLSLHAGGKCTVFVTFLILSFALSYVARKYGFVIMLAVAVVHVGGH